MRPVQRVPIAIFTTLLASFALAQHPDGKDDGDAKNPFDGKPEAIDSGRQLYMTSCAGCHGPNGEGGRGIRLALNGSVRGATNRRLFDSIKNGVRGSDMPASNRPDESIWQLVTYVKSINATAYDLKVPGNLESGENLFDGKGGCRGCHKIKGTGGVLGPDLSNVGAAQSVAQLREAILKPSERPTDGFQGVWVTTKTGQRIEGVAKDNTNYSISILDAKGKLHLLGKTDLVEVRFRQASVMPDNFETVFTKDQIQDLIAFLSRQAVRVPESKETESK